MTTLQCFPKVYSWVKLKKIALQVSPFTELRTANSFCFSYTGITTVHHFYKLMCSEFHQLSRKTHQDNRNLLSNVCRKLFTAIAFLGVVLL